MYLTRNQRRNSKIHCFIMLRTAKLRLNSPKSSKDREKIQILLLLVEAKVKQLLEETDEVNKVSVQCFIVFLLSLII